MPNMSYCRFQNTLIDVRDCQESLMDTDLSRDEFQARKRLLKAARELVETAEEYPEIETQTYEEYQAAVEESEDDE